MLDLSKFYSNNNSESRFGEQYTIEEIKESQGNAPMQVVPSKNNPGKFFFACGRVRGYVSQKTADKLAKRQATKALIVSEVTTDAGNQMLVLHEMGESSNAIATL